MKRDFNTWLTSLGACGAGEDARRNCAQWNVAHQRAGAIKYGQALLDISDEMDVAPTGRGTRPTATRTSG